MNKVKEMSEEAGESLTELITKLKTFQVAGKQLLKAAPGLEAREKERMRQFIRDKNINVAALAAVGPGRSEGSMLSVGDAQRSAYFRTSAALDPGPLSKFGEGDGSFFDSWLTNSRFHAPNGTFTYIDGNPMAKPAQIIPLTGLKQWTMPGAELKAAAARVSAASEGCLDFRDLIVRDDPLAPQPLRQPLQPSLAQTRRFQTTRGLTETALNR